MLKMAGIELELISDSDIHLCIDKGIIGGISYIAKRFSKVNKYIKSYGNKKPSKYIMYLDANNLYGWPLISIYLSWSVFTLQWIQMAKLKRN